MRVVHWSVLHVQERNGELSTWATLDDHAQDQSSLCFIEGILNVDGAGGMGVRNQKSRAIQLQRRYYQDTAATYDDIHIADDDEHGIALGHIVAQCNRIGIASIVDVGCGTGRAIHRLSTVPNLAIVGVEPVAELLAQAVGAPSRQSLGLVQASGSALPLRSLSVEAACATGVMHHVSDPQILVAEMMRVARVAIFISDYNRFGAGAFPWRWAKLALAKTGAWPLAYRLRTGGRGYHVSDGDGVAYSYSIYDSYGQLFRWADQIYVIPTARLSSDSWLGPLLGATHGLLCAIRSPCSETR